MERLNDTPLHELIKKLETHLEQKKLHGGGVDVGCLIALNYAKNLLEYESNYFEHIKKNSL